LIVAAPEFRESGKNHAFCRASGAATAPDFRVGKAGIPRKRQKPRFLPRVGRSDSADFRVGKADAK
jgi:hypothetical protein